MKEEIRTYINGKPEDRRDFCERLYKEISNALPDAENKVWHGAPVWFLAGNPIVGFHSLKDGIRLLFWSGESFDDPILKRVGTFKAAAKVYKSVEELDSAELRRWLQKSRDIQWDYGNIMKNKKLVRIEA